MRIRWTPAAATDLEDVHNYLKEHHPDWARSTLTEIRTAARSLKQFPNRGREGREEETRELLHPRLPYIVARPAGQNPMTG
jgi:plasmid stabilization system protein ParE